VSKRPDEHPADHSDQHRGDCYGFEGRSVKTPHLDQARADGTRFCRLHRAEPDLPADARSILTGLCR
jgi:arylsulfatase A-like enzyme